MSENTFYSELHAKDIEVGSSEWYEACVAESKKQQEDREAELVAKGFLTGAPRLSTIPFQQLQVGDKVFSAWSGSHGKIKELWPAHTHRDYTQWVVIEWENGKLTHQPHPILDTIEYRQQ